MSLRKIWVLSHPVGVVDESQPTGGVVFSKHFPTCEKRARILCADTYVPIPEDDEFYEGILAELGWRNQSEEFDAVQDSCKKYDHKPVFSLTNKDGTLWPIIVLEQSGLLFCCLPLVEEPIRQEKPPLVNISSIAVGFEFLQALAQNVGPAAKPTPEALLSLHLYVSQAAPFGCPHLTSPSAVTSILNGRASNTILTDNKQPAWRPVPHRGKSTLHLTLTESVRAVIYDSTTNPDVEELFGTVTCRAELEGAPRDVIVTWVPQTPGQDHVTPQHVVTHTCVHSRHFSSAAPVPAARRGSTSSLSPASCGQIKFCPGPDPFPLCHYLTPPRHGLPLTARYHAKFSGSAAQLLLTLQLRPGVRNNMDYLEVHLPFLARGIIVQVDAGTSPGQVTLTTNKRALVWSPGQRFPSKSLEFELKASVKFGENSEPPSLGTEDAFCTANNAYAKIFFKISDYTHSGLSIDTKSMTFNPPLKVKVNLVRELVTSEYRVWNSHGDALIAFPPPKTT